MRYFVICLILIVIYPLNVLAFTDTQFKIIKISEREGKAVVKINSRALKMIQIGDEVADLGIVEEIFESRIVIVSKNKIDNVRTIIKLENGVQKIEKISLMPKQQPVLYAPVEKFYQPVNISGESQINNINQKIGKQPDLSTPGRRFNKPVDESGEINDFIK